jgi:hypothetical protein
MSHKAPGQSSEILVRAYQRIRTSCPSIADRWIVDADIVDVMVAAYPSLDDPDTPLLNSAKFNKAVMLPWVRVSDLLQSDREE